MGILAVKLTGRCLDRLTKDIFYGIWFHAFRLQGIWEASTDFLSPIQWPGWSPLLMLEQALVSDDIFKIPLVLTLKLSLNKYWKINTNKTLDATSSANQLLLPRHWWSSAFSASMMESNETLRKRWIIVRWPWMTLPSLIPGEILGCL